MTAHILICYYIYFLYFIDSGVICNNKWNYINKECVLQEEFICDGIDHCVNRVDECQLNCQFSFNCNDGKCLPKVTRS